MTETKEQVTNSTPYAQTETVFNGTVPKEPFPGVDRRSTPSNGGTYPVGVNVKTIDKNLFTWVFCFFLGGFGADRFVRGQIGLGVVKLLFGWITLGIWGLIDWIIAMVKAYGSSYGNEDKFTFLNGKYSK